MDLHPSVAERLARLAPDQRAAATAPPGPSLCIAPAGSGKTTTLVARAAWLIATGTPPDAIRAITFNKRAAVEMTERLDAAVAPLGVAPGAVRVRTFHALGREILRDAGVAVEPMADRAAVLAEVAPVGGRGRRCCGSTPSSRGSRSSSASRPTTSRPIPDAGPVARAFVAYEARRRGDRRARLRRPHPARDRRPRARPGAAGALARTVPGAPRRRGPGRRSRPAPAWRSCWPRRTTGSSSSATTTSRSTAGGSPMCVGSSASRRSLPGLRRVDLEVNYRCPRPVVERAVRLVEHNGERFAKAIRRGPGGGRAGWSSRPTPSDETVRLERAMRTWPDDGSTRAVLARTNRELLPAVVVALELGLPFRAPRIDLLLESPHRRRAPRLAAAAATTTRRRARCWSRSGGSAAGVARRPAAPRRGRDGAARLGGRPFDDLAAFVDGHRPMRVRGWPTSAATTRR